MTFESKKIKLSTGPIQQLFLANTTPKISYKNMKPSYFINFHNEHKALTTTATRPKSSSCFYCATTQLSNKAKITHIGYGVYINWPSKLTVEINILLAHEFSEPHRGLKNVYYLLSM